MGLFTYDMNLDHIPEPQLAAAREGATPPGSGRTRSQQEVEEEEKEEKECDEMQLDVLWQVGVNDWQGWNMHGR